MKKILVIFILMQLSVNADAVNIGTIRGRTGNVATVTSSGQLRIEDTGVLLAAGSLTGYSTVNKFGQNEDSAAGVLEDIWDGSTTYSYPSVATMTHISQTADQVALRGGKIEIQGLDSSWNLNVQTATLNSSNTTTPTALSTPLIRAFRMKVVTNTVSNSPIRLHNAAETVDYAIIGSGNNQTLMALYTVPNNKTAYMVNYYCSVTRSTANDPTGTEIRLWAADRKNDYEFQIKHAIGLPSASTPYDQPFYPYVKFTERTDIKMTSFCTDKAGDVHAGFDLILVDD